MVTRRSEHADLLNRATHCDERLDLYPGDHPDHVRAREMLRGTATACRSAARVFDLDPTLADEPYDTGRFRAIAVLAEIARQLPAFLAGTVFSSHPRLERYSPDERWTDAEHMYARLRHLADQIPAVVPRPHDTVAQIQAISSARLAARHTDVAAAADSLRAAVASALRLQPSHPRARELAELADKLQRHADELATDHDTSARASAHALALAFTPPDPAVPQP